MVERAGDHDEPLGAFVDNKFDNVGEPRSNGGKGYVVVGGNYGRVAGQVFEEGAEVGDSEAGDAEGVAVPGEGGAAPEGLDKAAHVGGEAGEFGLDGVGGLDEIGFGGVNVQQVVEEGGAFV